MQSLNELGMLACTTTWQSILALYMVLTEKLAKAGKWQGKPKKLGVFHKIRS